MRGIGLAAAVAAAALSVPTLVAAAAPLYCGARNDVLTKLAGDYREQPASVALTSDGQLLEVLKSDTKLTWSILITSPNGVSCLVAAGESWQDKEADVAAVGPRT
jgi:hypothetical protein